VNPSYRLGIDKALIEKHEYLCYALVTQPANLAWHGMCLHLWHAVVLLDWVSTSPQAA
jgi:hypothetical protein